MQHRWSRRGNCRCGGQGCCEVGVLLSLPSLDINHPTVADTMSCLFGWCHHGKAQPAFTCSHLVVLFAGYHTKCHPV